MIMRKYFNYNNRIRMSPFPIGRLYLSIYTNTNCILVPKLECLAMVTEIAYREYGSWKTSCIFIWFLYLYSKNVNFIVIYPFWLYCWNELSVFNHWNLSRIVCWKSDYLHHDTFQILNTISSICIFNLTKLWNW